MVVGNNNTLIYNTSFWSTQINSTLTLRSVVFFVGISLDSSAAKDLDEVLRLYNGKARAIAHPDAYTSA